MQGSVTTQNRCAAQLCNPRWVGDALLQSTVMLTKTNQIDHTGLRCSKYA
jgi:hypothetical protein